MSQRAEQSFGICLFGKEGLSEGRDQQRTCTVYWIFLFRKKLYFSNFFCRLLVHPFTYLFVYCVCMCHDSIVELREPLRIVGFLLRCWS